MCDLFVVRKLAINNSSWVVLSFVCSVCAPEYDEAFYVGQHLVRGTWWCWTVSKALPLNIEQEARPWKQDVRGGERSR